MNPRDHLGFAAFMAWAVRACYVSHTPDDIARDAIRLNYAHDTWRISSVVLYPNRGWGDADPLFCRHCGEDGELCASHRGTFDPFPGTDATMFIQWKGTNVCMDFHCPCQPDELAYSSHFDGLSAYYVECPACGAVYELGTQVRARRVGSAERGFTPKMLDMDD